MPGLPTAMQTSKVFHVRKAKTKHSMGLSLMMVTTLFFKLMLRGFPHRAIETALWTWRAWKRLSCGETFTIGRRLFIAT